MRVDGTREARIELHWVNQGDGRADYVPVDLQTLIAKVYVSPGAPRWLAD